MSNVEELADLAERLVPTAQRLVGAVHFDGVAAVSRLIAQMDTQERTAVMVLLAAMVDPDRQPSELLAWADSMLPAETRHPSLFDGIDLASDPRTWSDATVRDLWLEHRRKPNTPRSLGEQERLVRGYREYERRRAAARLRPAEATPKNGVVR